MKKKSIIRTLSCLIVFPLLLTGCEEKQEAEEYKPSIVIGENGNWFIDGVDTGVKANANDGTNGNNGLSAYEIYLKYYPGYSWGEEQWIKDLANNQLKVAIEFDTVGGENIDPVYALKGEEVTISVEPVRPHASFLGWYYDSNYEQEITYTFIASESTTFYAKYDVEKVSVSFVADGAPLTYKSCEWGSPVELPDNPTKLGYTFVGWTKSDGTLWVQTTPVQQTDLVLSAKFDYDFLEIPAVIINTEDGAGITSKEVYKNSTVSILNTKEEWTLTDVAAGVRGRGNSSWGFDKKPYRIKFNKKQSVLGSTYQAKSWTLIANHSDKSLLRNYMAYEMGDRFDEIAFSSKHNLVDLYLNNQYQGVYLLCDQMQTGEGRVAIDESIAADGNNGYLIERDARAPGEGVLNQDYFVFQGQEYTIKTPDTEDETYLNNKDVEIAYISNYMQQCLTAITSGTWDQVKDLIDVDSFAASYIVDELYANNDCGFASCYYYKDKDGKFSKGPLWDFDIGAGNCNYNLGNAERCEPNTSLWASAANAWYGWLLSRDEFKELVAEKLESLRTKIFDVLKLLDLNDENNIYAANKNAMDRNFQKWQIMGAYVWPEPQTVYTITDVGGQVTYLHDWLLARYKYLYKVYTGEDFYEAYRGVFEIDEHVTSILVYNTSDYTQPGTASLEAFSRDSSTGALLKDGEGQINFEVVLENGYEIDSVTVTGDYKNLKGPSDTGKDNTYRITKVKSHLTITVTTKVAV